MGHNKLSPKKILVAYITVTLCIHLGYADDFNHAEEFSGQDEGRQFKNPIPLEVANHPAGNYIFKIINTRQVLRKT